jgi:large subunit ribosomal protein L21
MSKYAVIEIKGQQFKVSQGDEILVGKLNKEKPEARVLLVVDGEKIKIGKPVVKNAKVELKVVNEEEKGKKLYVYKFKAKSRYRRKMGFRPVYSRLLVEKISL